MGGCLVADFDARRAGLVQKAAEDWKAALIDIGGRNNLLHYRDLKLGTLDLSAASEDALVRLFGGKTIRVSSLFSGAEQGEQALRRARTIYRKATENSEERGLETVSIGCGLATWDNPRGTWAPSAPVLLQGASLVPLGVGQDDFECTVTGDLEVSPTLLHALTVGFGCRFDQSALMARIPDGTINEAWELREAYKWITEQASGVPGFRVDDRTVLANFAYAKLEMVRDLDAAGIELAGHDLIAALAGDERARTAIHGQGPDPDAVPSPDQMPLADEFIVLDADSSQSYAINAVLCGQHLIIKGPPGTGKSQTISNLIASLAARGKKVLFVAEKRAAIEAVTKRLGQRGLGDLVLDLHGGVTSKRAFAQSIGVALDGIKSTPPPGNAAVLADVEARRERLNAYSHALSDPRMPWGLSVYDMRMELLGLADVSSRARFPRQLVAGLGSQAFVTIRGQLEQYADLGGLTLSTSGNAWARSPVTSEEEARQADGVLRELLGTSLPATAQLLGRACQVTGVPYPPTLAAAAPLIAVWTKITAQQAAFSPALYQLDLRAERDALAPAARGGLARIWASLSSGNYRAARARVRATALTGSKVTDRALVSAVAGAGEIVDSWAGLGLSGALAAPREAADCATAYGRVRDSLATLEVLAGRTGLADLPIAECQRALDELEADRAVLGRLPQLHLLRTALEQAGLSQLLHELAERNSAPDTAVRSLRYAYLRSILDQLSLSDLRVGSFSGEAHQRVVEAFAAGDRGHIEATPARIRRAYAEGVIRALDAYPEQAALVRHQAGLKRKHRPVREFVRNAADVLLAVKPCWAMSPLVVSQLLPPDSYFDVVIFDEASQVTPADAVTSILRGKQLVVAGDDKQLPPTAFFASAGPEDERSAEEPFAEEASLMAGTGGFESILDALGSLLRFRMLTWHYRSRDERLIAFSNQHIYDRMLTTFPGADGDRVLRFVPAAWAPGASTNSPAPEVAAVVDLILEHARERPSESLGVITMGITHSNRIEEALRQRLRDDPHLARGLGGFFDESREDRFFVKNIERVQGDERDATILSVGYGKDSNGRLPYRFGPLLTEGGERRLNVAVTRARNRVTLVSSFSAGDMDPERSAARGVRLLRQYLQYAESGATNLGDQAPAGLRATLNPFEADVRDTLTARGLRLTPQHGVSGYWIDFAVKHPEQPGHYVLAIECDGASYHSSASARDRDRLRQEHLERLGWRFHRIWSSDWFSNKEACADAVMAAYERALSAEAAAPPGPAPRPRFRPSDLDDAPRSTGNGSGPVQTVQPQRDATLNPCLLRGLPITDYPDGSLRLLAQWIRSDQALRTEDELMTEMMRELGFQKRGSRITSRLSQAIAQTRR
jgi:very-short-patch-repair endonuclease/DNA polymerase III delta prime subunit